MESIPIDLVLEIFLRLPSKSIARFRCLSKLWRSLLHRSYFTELFLTRSSARPHLLFAIQKNGTESCFYTAPQLQNPYEKSSLPVAADFHTKFSGTTCGYESGLIILRYKHKVIDREYVPKICNPHTGQYAELPKQRCPRWSYIGFDPIDKQFKVLAMDEGCSAARDDHQILTLGTGKLRWRKIHCPLSQSLYDDNVCISGVLYFLSTEEDETYSIVCFDFRSEKFKLIDGDYRECFHDFYSHLVNYKGKLGLTFWRFGEDANELRLWVLEDVEKHVWSKYVYTLPKIEVCDPPFVSVVGVTAMGQIVLSMDYVSKKPFYVFYFNPQDETLHSVEIQGFEGVEVGWRVRVCTYVEHVEDLKVSDAKLFRSSIAVPSMKNKITTSRRGKRKRWFK